MIGNFQGNKKNHPAIGRMFLKKFRGPKKFELGHNGHVVITDCLSATCFATTLGTKTSLEGCEQRPPKVNTLELRNRHHQDLEPFLGSGIPLNLRIMNHFLDRESQPKATHLLWLLLGHLVTLCPSAPLLNMDTGYSISCKGLSCGVILCDACSSQQALWKAFQTNRGTRRNLKGLWQ